MTRGERNNWQQPSYQAALESAIGRNPYVRAPQQRLKLAANMTEILHETQQTGEVRKSEICRQLWPSDVSASTQRLIRFTIPRDFRDRSPEEKEKVGRRLAGKVSLWLRIIDKISENCSHDLHWLRARLFSGSTYDDEARQRQWPTEHEHIYNLVDRLDHMTSSVSRKAELDAYFADLMRVPAAYDSRLDAFVPAKRPMMNANEQGMNALSEYPSEVIPFPAVPLFRWRVSGEPKRGTLWVTNRFVQRDLPIERGFEALPNVDGWQSQRIEVSAVWQCALAVGPMRFPPKIEPLLRIRTLLLLSTLGDIGPPVPNEVIGSAVGFLFNAPDGPWAGAIQLDQTCDEYSDDLDIPVLGNLQSEYCEELVFPLDYAACHQFLSEPIWNFEPELSIPEVPTRYPGNELGSSIEKLLSSSSDVDGLDTSLIASAKHLRKRLSEFEATRIKRIESIENATEKRWES